MDFKILFNDNDIVVCEKPQGIISQADTDGKENMVDLLQKVLDETIYPVHRLDKQTGGIIVYAKRKKAAATLSKAILENRFNKQYLALVHGNVCPDSSELTDFLFWDRNRNKSFVVKRERKGVKKAVLQYDKLTVVRNNEKEFSLLKVILKTGRTHQIRVQFSSRGYPLIGDNRYGAKDFEKSLGLWAYMLEFNHPTTNEKLSFENLPYNSSAFKNINFHDITL